MGLCQIKRGAVDGQLAMPVAGAILQDGAGNNMAINITPQRRGWWVVNAEAIHNNPAATWLQGAWGILLNQADLTGYYGYDQNYVVVHATLGWNSSSVDTAYQLEAGVAYTATLYSTKTPATTMYYWTGKDYFYIQGEFVGEGGL